MRTLRATVAATSLLLLFGIQGAAVGAADSVDTPAVVTGTESCMTVTMGTDSVSVDPLVDRYHGHVSECLDETSDPRVSGTWRNTFNEDCYLFEGQRDHACIIWGTHVLDGERGGWDCSYSGTDDLWSANAGQVLVVCPGSGEYEGLTYVVHHVFGGVQDFGDGTDLHGIIYEGPPPAWGPIEQLDS